jgi:hypothetical protein
MLMNNGSDPPSYDEDRPVDPMAYAISRVGRSGVTRSVPAVLGSLAAFGDQMMDLGR